MHRLLAKLDKELKKYAEKDGELSAAEWKCVYDAVQARKDLLTSMAMTGEDADGNYEDMNSGYSGRYYNRGRSMGVDPEWNYSGAARRRDSMGRYSGNYSGHNNPALDALYDMLSDAESNDERMMIQRRIDKMERRYS